MLGLLWKQTSRYLKTLFIAALALFSIVGVLLPINSLVALLPAAATLLILIKRVFSRIFKGEGRYRISHEQVPRILLSLLPLIIYLRSENTIIVATIFYTLLPLLTMGEPTLNRVLELFSRSRIEYGNFQVETEALPKIFSLRTIADYHLLCISTALAMSVWGFNLYIALSLVLIELFLLARIALLIIKKYEPDNINDTIHQALTDYAPKFALYFSAPKGTVFHIAMWMEYLERIGLSFIVITREKHSFDAALELTKVPVFFCPRIIDLDTVVVDSLNTCFYVNNGMRNTHMVRFAHLTHIQLLHGDSDKAPSFNPVTAMFDKIFVAGQAGIERYANNGIDIPLHKFEIVGRPQVENVKRDISDEVKTVLYAPTWAGYYQDSNYSSLSVARELISKLIELKRTIIFRPHPYSYKNTEHKKIIAELHQMLESDAQESGRQHVWGEQAETSYSVFDCFNQADAMISDVSSVVPDFLFSEKPFAMMAMLGSGSEFEAEFPLSKVAYVIEKDLSNLDESLDKLLYTDPKKEDRKAARIHYLGDFPQQDYASHFIETAKKIITES